MAGICMCLWDTFMNFLSIAFSVITMYEYNRSGVHRYFGLSHSENEETIIVANARGAWQRRLGLGTGIGATCGVDLTEWTTIQHWTVNWTFVVAIVMWLDQFRILISNCCRKGNPLFYFAMSDNLQNLATSLIESFSTAGILVPNSVAYVSKQVSQAFKNFLGNRGVTYYATSEEAEQADVMASVNHDHGYTGVPSAKELDEICDADDAMLHYTLDRIWEWFVSVIIFGSLLQCIMMPIFGCEMGPTLDQDVPGKPKVNFLKWRDYDHQSGGYTYVGNHCLVNVAFILSLFFVLDVIIQFRASSSYFDYYSDVTKMHKLVIAFQTLCLDFNLPVPVAMGRFVKPIMVMSGVVGRKRTYYAKVHEEVFGTREVMHGHEHHEIPGGCCTRGALNRWQC